MWHPISGAQCISDGSGRSTPEAIAGWDLASKSNTQKPFLCLVKFLLRVTQENLFLCLVLIQEIESGFVEGRTADLLVSRQKPYSRGYSYS